MDNQTDVILKFSSNHHFNESDRVISHDLMLWYRYDIYTGGVITVAYSLVFLIGLVGNLLVTLAVLKGDNEMSQSITNIFLVNLAVADLLVIITCLPYLHSSLI